MSNKKKNRINGVNNSFFERIFNLREFVVLTIVLIVFVFLAISAKQFLTIQNFRSLGNYMATDMIIAAFLTISLIAGNTDLSVGSNLGCSGFVCGLMLNHGHPIPICIIGGLLTGLFIGFFNATVITRLKVPPFIATIGAMFVFKGVGLLIINSTTLSNFPTSFNNLVQGRKILGIPTLIFVMLVIVILVSFLLKKVSFFRQAFFIGSNLESAKLAGINVNKFFYISYILTGLAAALAGVLSISRYGSAPASLGQNIEFRIISGILIGGTSLSGGDGSIIGTFLGVLLMALLNNALTLHGVDANVQQIFTGGILISAVAIDQAKKKHV